MILNLRLYSKVSFFKSWLSQRKLRKFSGDKVFKIFKLHRTEWPSRLYFYSPRLKRVPRFTGNLKLLMGWKEAKDLAEACPTSAITIKENDFIINPRGCITCGLCFEMAPEGLLEMSAEIKK
jgi:NAD-dependent dihydropyrimidine dehydrogenase PreA subunit